MFDSIRERPTPTLNDAIKMVAASLDVLARVEIEAEDDRALLDALVTTQEVKNRLDGQQLRVLEAVDRRDAHALDGAMHPAAWLRSQTHQAPAEASMLLKAAVRLRRFPELRDALESGAITSRHVTAVTRQSIPRRIDAIAAMDGTLAELARHAPPADVEAVVTRITDALDHAEEVDPLPPSGPDERRELTLLRGIDGLGQLFATLDPLDAELLDTLLDAFETPDPPDTSPEQQRSAAQRRADAFTALLKAVASGKRAGTVDGYPAMIVAIIDLLSLLGLDTLAEAAQVTDAQVDAIADLAGVDEATARRIAEAAVSRGGGPGGGGDPVGDVPGLGQPARTPRLRFGGPTSPGVIRRLADSAKVQAVLTFGPWRAVSVGRVQRTLPPWLRTALTGIHGHCRGPDCDLPVAWCDAHHAATAWTDGGETDLNETIPACRRHHQTLTLGTWNAVYDCDTGACTWTGPDDQTIVTRPPPL